MNNSSEPFSEQFDLLILLRKINRINTIILRLFIVVLFSLAVGLYFFQLLCRFFFQSSFFWIDSFIQYSFILSAFYGVVLATTKNEHLKIDLFKKLQKHLHFKIVFNGICFLLSLCLLTLYFQYTFFTNNKFHQSLSDTFGAYSKNIPMVFLFFSMALSFSEVALNSLWSAKKKYLKQNKK